MNYRDPKEIADICKALGYHRKKYALYVQSRVTLQGLNWEGGSRSVYTAIDLATLSVRSPNLSLPAPWNNAAEGATVELPDGTALAKTGTFLGKPSMLYLYVRPDNLVAAIGQETVP